MRSREMAPPNSGRRAPGRTLTYAELGQLVDRAARGFQKIGVVHGARVGLCLPNSPYFVIAYYAVLKAGGIVVTFNPLCVAREIARQVEDFWRDDHGDPGRRKDLSEDRRRSRRRPVSKKSLSARCARRCHRSKACSSACSRRRNSPGFHATQSTSASKSCSPVTAR